MIRTFITLGLVLGAAAVYVKYKRNRPPKVFVRDKLVGNYNARTIPPFGIYVSKEHVNNHQLLGHEKKHWQQFQKLGLIKFYKNYAEQLRTAGYDAMEMEVEARENESEHCRTNYTACVRDGRSVTVYNPDFRD